MDTIQQTEAGVVVSVRVVPRASRSEVTGIVGNTLKVRLQAPPVEGKANKALAKFLAGQLGVRPRDVSILSGETARTKRVLIRDARIRDVRAIFS